MKFAVDLIASNPRWFRYDLVWSKVGTTGFLDANRKPLRAHEHILVFGPKRLPEAGRALGKGMREFKDSITGKDEERPELPTADRERDAAG